MSKEPASIVELTAKDLLPSGRTYCPNPKADMERWRTHPRVYLIFDEHNEVLCPYCSTLYRIKEGETVTPRP